MTRRAAVPSPRPLLIGLAALVAVVATLACDGNGGPNMLGTVLTLTCTPDSTTVSAGNLAGVGFRVVLTEGGAAVPNRTVALATTAGTVVPDTAVTGTDGAIEARFYPPSVAGTAVISSQVIDGAASDQVATSCTISVVGAADPRVSVTVLAPAQLAGLQLAVTYDRFGLAVTSIETLGGLAGTDCLTDSDAPGNGTVTIAAACPTLRAVGGSEVARITFDNLDGDTHDVGEFQVTCSGVDVTGSPVGTACSLSVTQL